MDSRLLLLNALCVGIWAVHFAHAECPNKSLYAPCQCISERFRMLAVLNCKDVSGEAIRDVMNAVKAKNKIITQLIVENDVITSLPENTFGSARIGVLTLKTPNLESLPPNVFTGQKYKLGKLYIKASKLSSIPVETLSSLENLRELALDNSKGIQEIKKDTFDRLSNINSISYLSLRGDGIREIEEGAFSKFTNLEFLYLDDNDLVDLSADILPEHKLQTISLSGNNLKSFPIDFISKVEAGGELLLKRLSIVKVTSEEIDAILRNGVTVNLMDNPLDCDCAFRKIAVRFETSANRYIIGTCSSPANLASQSTLTLSTSEFKNCS